MSSPADELTPILLRGVDRAAFAAAFASRLRRGGVPVSLPGITVFVRALTASPPVSLSRLYWTARISLLVRQSEIAAFDAVFAAMFGGAGLLGEWTPVRTGPGAPRTPRDGRSGPAPDQSASQPDCGLPWLTRPPVATEPAPAAASHILPERLPSDLDGLADLPFDELDAAELDLLGDWLAAALRSWPTRRTRRRVVDRSGRRIALRPTIARSRRTGGEPLDLVRVRAVRKPRPVVMLCDVSQSMQAQATAYLHLMRVLAVAARAEVFAFATALTRLTPLLGQKSAALAIEQATAAVTDRFGGTRIAANLDAFLSSHHGNAARGAVVLIGSDGWDSDPPQQLARAMARLRRRAYRVVWLNPRAAAPGFEPRVAGMAAALPYCDQLLPADTFRSLAAVLRGLPGQ